MSDKPDDAVTGFVESEEMVERILIDMVNLVRHTRTVTNNRRSEGTVQPPTPLTDQLRCTFGHIRFRLGRLYIVEDPALIGFCGQLETQDTIFS